MTPKQTSSIREIVSLFDEAELKVKEIEQLAQELSVPSINELRYVGYHLARALCTEDESKLTLEIQKAKGHCQRALYDAYEIGIIHMLEQIKLFKERYVKHSHFINDVVSGYVECLIEVDNASSFIVDVRKEASDDRGEYYKRCGPYFEQLRVICSKFDQATPLIDAKIHQDKIQSRRFILGLSVSLMIGGIMIFLRIIE